jgi:hypothetical protein
MRPFIQMLLLTATLPFPAVSLLAQSAVDPSGHWQGTIQTPGTALGFEIDLATGRIVNLDEGGLQVPVAITQKASTVTLDSTVVVFSLAGTLNAAATELAGTFTQGALVVPLTFRRATASEGRR